MWAVLWCRGGDVKWAAGAAGAGPELLSLSPLSARPQTGGFVASGRPHRPKCASVPQWENRRMRGRNAQANTQGNRTYQGFESVVGKIFPEHSAPVPFK